MMTWSHWIVETVYHLKGLEILMKAGQIDPVDIDSQQNDNDAIES